MVGDDDVEPVPDGVPLGAGAFPVIAGPDPASGFRVGCSGPAAGAAELLLASASGAVARRLVVLNGCPYGIFTAARPSAARIAVKASAEAAGAVSPALRLCAPDSSQARRR